MHNPFEALKKNPELRNRLKRAARPVPLEKKEPGPLSEEDVFLAAVAGVTPLGPGGRAVTPPVSRKTPAAPPSFSSLLEDAEDSCTSRVGIGLETDRFWDHILLLH